MHDLTGAQFGRLTVLHRADDYYSPNGTMRVIWQCRCVCGREVAVRASSLRDGGTKSCGCLRRDWRKEQKA